MSSSLSNNIGLQNGQQRQLPESSTALARRSRGGASTEAIAKAAQEFEGFFLEFMMREMRQSIPEGGLMDSGAVRIFEGMLDQHFAESSSQGQGIGLADQIARQYGVAPEELRDLRLAAVERPGGRARALGQYGATSQANLSAHPAAPAGAMALPLGSAPVSSGYGPRIHPILGGRHHHTGIDFAAPMGAPIRAAASGRVVSVGERGAYGLTVEIEHGNGTTSLYAHQSSVQVEVGQRVRSGQVIGAVGDSGRSTGPHLHFEVRKDGRAVDPTPLLRGLANPTAEE